MERFAEVARIEGDHAFLKFDASGGCGRCASAGGCQSGVLNEIFGARCSLQRVPCPPGVAVGDRVQVAGPPGLVWRAALLLYGLPLIAGLAGAALGAGVGEAASVAGLVGGLLAGFGVARLASGRARWARALPVIARVEAHTGFFKEAK